MLSNVVHMPVWLFLLALLAAYCAGVGMASHVKGVKVDD